MISTQDAGKRFPFARHADKLPPAGRVAFARFALNAPWDWTLNFVAREEASAALTGLRRFTPRGKARG